MNKMIDSFLKHVPSESWIKKSSGVPWLKLNLEVPTSRISKEALDLYPLAVEHRAHDKFSHYSHQGWKSIALYGVNSKTTEHVESAALTWTEVSHLCPDTINFINQYWDIDDSTGRIRFMYLEPGGYILPHSDRKQKGFSEVNVAITNPDNCRFRFLEYGTVPFKPGTAFCVDISNKHFVVNDSNELRVHMIVHGSLKKGIVKLSYEQSFYS